MNILRFIQPLLKRHTNLNNFKSEYYLFCNNFCSIISNQSSVSRTRLLPKCCIPMQMKTRGAVTKSSPLKEEKLRLKDGIPSGYELIYKAPINSYMVVAHGLSSVLSLVLCAVGGFKYIKGDLNLGSQTVYEFGDIIQSDEQFFALIAAFLIANISLQAFISKYPLRIYKKTDCYIAVYVGRLPILTRKVEFKAGEVIRVPASGIMPWKFSWFKIHDKNAIILESHFRKPVDFHSMMQEK